MQLTERVTRMEKRQRDAIMKAQSEYLASLSDEWLLEYLGLSIRQWVSGFESPPRLSELSAPERERVAWFKLDDALLATYHTNKFSAEQEARISAMEQELLDGWKARGLPEAWFWAQ